MNKILLILISLSLATFSFFSVQAEEGKVLVQENCSSCHENPDLYLVSLSDMSHLTKNEMVKVLSTGKMKTQAKNLTNSEKEKIASFLTKGEADQGQVEAFLCDKNLDAKDLQGDSLWTSWGHDSFNTRNQKSRILILEM
jgi:cytochrome c553